MITVKDGQKYVLYCKLAANECVLFHNQTNLDRSRLRRDRYSPVKKNAERFARIDLDLSDFEKERTQYLASLILAQSVRYEGIHIY